MKISIAWFEKIGSLMISLFYYIYYYYIYYSWRPHDTSERSLTCRFQKYPCVYMIKATLKRWRLALIRSFQSRYIIKATLKRWRVALIRSFQNRYKIWGKVKPHSSTMVNEPVNCSNSCSFAPSTSRLCVR